MNCFGRINRRSKSIEYGHKVSNNCHQTGNRDFFQVNAFNDSVFNTEVNCDCKVLSVCIIHEEILVVPRSRSVCFISLYISKSDGRKECIVIRKKVCIELLLKNHIVCGLIVCFICTGICIIKHITVAITIDVSLECCIIHHFRSNSECFTEACQYACFNCCSILCGECSINTCLYLSFDYCIDTSNKAQANHGSKCTVKCRDCS